MARRFKFGIVVFAIVALGWTSFCVGQVSQPTPVPAQENRAEQSEAATSIERALPGTISGTVVDQSGAVIAGARVRLTRTGEDPSFTREALSGGDGQFSFVDIPPGHFQLTVMSAGFATLTSSGVLQSGQIYLVPQIALTVAADVTEVQVALSPVEIAEEQIKVQEKQRVLGVLPNFYVSYVPNAAPLNAGQKFRLAWKTVIDPFTFVFVGGAAGVEQAQNHFAEYGQGAEGYAKRFGAGYADMFAGMFIGGAILPSLLKQDPRYFYKGTGSKPSRALYAIGNSVICKGDNGRWQANYSNVLGSLAAGGISNLYYPEQDRNGAGLTLENGAIGIGATAVANLFQEFLLRHLTPKLPDKAHNPAPNPAPGKP